MSGLLRSGIAGGNRINAFDVYTVSNCNDARNEASNDDASWFSQ